MYDRLDDIKDILKLRKEEVRNEYVADDGKNSASNIGKLRGRMDALSFSLIVMGKESPEELRATFPEYMKIIDENRAKRAERKTESVSKPHIRFVELHPPYPGAVWTGSCRGATYSGHNNVERSISQEAVCNREHNYYEVTSGEASLQDYSVALCWTIPDDFRAWAEMNPIVIDFRTESGTYLNAHVGVKIYKAGWASGLSESSHNTDTGWAVIIIEPMDVKGWKPGDVMEIYLKLASRNDYYARVGSIRFNYVAK